MRDRTLFNRRCFVHKLKAPDTTPWRSGFAIPTQRFFIAATEVSILQRTFSRTSQSAENHRIFGSSIVEACVILKSYWKSYRKGLRLLYRCDIFVRSWMKLVQIPLLRDNYGYLIVCQKTNSAAIVDPSESEPVLRRIEQENVTL